MCTGGFSQSFFFLRRMKIEYTYGWREEESWGGKSVPSSIVRRKERATEQYVVVVIRSIAMRVASAPSLPSAF